MGTRLKKVTVCALPFTAALLAFPASSAAAAGSAQQSQMRYAEMDTNRDGVITRSEWTGTWSAFNAADWNRDGVLSGREVWNSSAQSPTRNPGDFDLSIDNRDERDDRAARFEYLDTNRNGLIERREWRGSTAGFDALDRNNDNVLTRAEMVTERAVGTSGATIRDRFDEMDVNNDGVITRAEWFGTRVGFGRVDADNNGVITRREYRVNQAPGFGNGAVRRQPLTREFVTVDAGQNWVNTGLYINPGDTITFDADGSVVLSRNGSDTATPDGARSGRKAANAPLRDQPAGALIGRIGNSNAFMVGAHRVLRAAESGDLWLTVNDDHFPDNEGSYRVTVSIAGVGRYR